MAKYVISIGSAPRRKSKYLTVQEGTKFRAVAKFLSEDDADYFKSILLGVLPIHKDEDD